MHGCDTHSRMSHAGGQNHLKLLPKVGRRLERPNLDLDSDNHLRMLVGLTKNVSWPTI